MNCRIHKFKKEVSIQIKNKKERTRKLFIYKNCKIEIVNNYEFLDTQVPGLKFGCNLGEPFFGIYFLSIIKL